MAIFNRLLYVYQRVTTISTMAGYAYGGSSRPSAGGSSLDCLQLLKARKDWVARPAAFGKFIFPSKPNPLTFHGISIVMGVLDGWFMSGNIYPSMDDDWG